MSYWSILDKNRSRFAEWSAIASSPGDMCVIDLTNRIIY